MTRCYSVHAAVVAACCWLLPVSALAQPVTGSVSPFNGNGAPGTQHQITITASDPGGWPNISHLDVLINSVASGANACFFVYFPNLNSIYLWNDGATTWAPGYADVGNHTGSTSNSHCTIYGSGSSISQSGSVLTLTFNVSFNFANGTLLYYWEHVVENGGADSGWWQIINGSSNPASFLVQAPNQPPTVGTVTPAYENIAANSSTMLRFTGSDPNGSSDVAEMDVLINSVPDGAAAAFGYSFRIKMPFTSS
jgi:hypothetical protein